MNKRDKLINTIETHIKDLKKKEKLLKENISNDFYTFFESSSEDLLKTQFFIKESENTLLKVSNASMSEAKEFLINRRQEILSTTMKSRLIGVSQNPFFTIKYLCTIEIRKKIAFQMYNWLSILE